ncbi:MULTISPECIES: winged helix-turn-helix transcriptional regulator [Flectobacillus]|jgi:DNA-binding HxlR family transcriptional regulator|uniref:Helix-turn-helix domain-containing protein n=1 Tax=Flectobacillus roseus TaxID=502259 RepID=A0ABT6YAY1_9BACT|nr:MULTISPECIES: helix-turn-helix domain-containing protein [Flectobacillus]MDI9860721.1 helix-turn-helix domain-containing protein [Flectobacillus roseus]PAC33473.1 transcriptional regulator [Flectobacillus sp. BAB-3569]
MTAIKESSTIQQNKKTALELCPVTFTMEKIGGYWKPIIIYHLSQESKRYSELKKAIPAITEKVLIQHLKQLEADGLLIREAKPVVPPFVTYQLSESGKKLLPVIHAMATWAFEHQGKSVDMEGK